MWFVREISSVCIKLHSVCTFSFVITPESSTTDDFDSYESLIPSYDTILIGDEL